MYRTQHMMASKALSNQVAAKWQDSFNRLNRAAPGISGLMEFSRVRIPFVNPRPWHSVLQHGDAGRRAFAFYRPGQSPQKLSDRGSLERLRKTLVSYMRTV